MHLRMETQENVEQLHGNLRNIRARSSSAERDDTGANDLTIGLPDHILCHIFSFLSLREAARTSILSRRWRYFWRSSLNLNFDIRNMAQTNARRMEHLIILINNRNAVGAGFMMLQDMKRGFVTWVNQVLNLHAAEKIVSFRVHFPLFGEYSDNVDQWIRNVAAKGVEELHIILSSSHPCLQSYKRYRFPFWAFAQADGRCFLKHLSLDYCTFNPPRDFCLFRNLNSLALRYVRITQENLDSIFSCMVLESFSMSRCMTRSELKISSSPAYLKLKHLSMSNCRSLTQVEICDAPSLLSFEYRGIVLRHLLFKNSAKPVKLCFLPCWYHEAGETYSFRQLSFGFPELQTLTFGYISTQDFKIPEQLPTFGKLKEVMLILEDMETALGLTKKLLMASPLLHRLEVNLPNRKTSNMPKILDLENLFQHNCLKEVNMFNFHGVPLELQLAIYLLKSAVALERITTIRREQSYEGDGKWVKSTQEPEVTKEQVLELFMGDVPASVKLIVF